MAIAGCVSHTSLSVQDQERIQTKYVTKTYFLKQSFFVGPFFAYADRMFISERAFDEKVLIQSPGGDPIVPCEPVGVVPMGTRVTVREIEFPTGSALAARKLKSPRHFTWVTVDLEGKNLEKPYVLVLTREFKTRKEFVKSLGGFLVEADPRPEFAALSPEVLRAIDRKSLVKGMDSKALLRSRGHPNRITRKFVDGTKMEKWLYTQDRFVVLKEDVVDEWQGFPDLDLANTGGNDTLDSSGEGS
jgi:hypothetical protein